MIPVSQLPNMETLELDDNGVDPSTCRKLAILGLPWDTSEDTLREYFSQFGSLEGAEVMKDRYTGKSRGFGFVSFVDPACAMRALNTEHSIDGRRCEAKIALPKGDPTPPRTTRIFVARIPPSVTETQFRSYFESFGKLQDAYMPKDHSKQGYRGIGFVTFTCADSVEKIMAVKHWLNGHEIAIDRATPKEEPSVLRNMFARMPVGPNTRRSFDNGAGIIGPGLINVGHPTASHGVDVASSSGYNQLRALSEDRQIPGISTGARLDPVMEIGSPSSQGYVSEANGQQGFSRPGMPISIPGLGTSAAAAAAAAAATTAALQSLAKSQHDKAMMSMGQSAIHNLSNDISASLLSNALNKGHMGGSPSPSIPDMNAAVQQLMAAAAVAQGGRRSLDAATAHLKRMGQLQQMGGMAQMGGMGQLQQVQQIQHQMQQVQQLQQQLQQQQQQQQGAQVENPAIANARAGPRIFIGKLTKETSELDVREYFSRFGYVMDVYLPKSKDNKGEHRGFGFVTFETEAAIQRVVQHGTHRLKGSTIAIDLAMPKVEEESGMTDAEVAAAAAPLLTLPQQLSLMQRL